jgi:hypothetical protein
MLPADLYLYLFHKIYGVEVDIRALALDEEKLSASRPVRFTPEVTAIGTLLVRGWLGTRGGLTIQLSEIPVASAQHRHDTC